ncbi:MAG: DUF3795 domain-containing protein [candidate division Zixibacteria bacterium]|jgi:hypothetical protein|nr:DUF3795 domain-containing protein [candidate division Zixibacteria bacterium]
MAKSHVGACGKICLNCAIFIATTTGDNLKKSEIASGLSIQQNKKIKPSSINCWGCGAPDRSCMNRDCYFRGCAHDRGLEYCYRCPKFECNKLKELYQENPSFKENLRLICKNGLDSFLMSLVRQ